MPLGASSGAVTAYLRRSGNHFVLIVVNLGTDGVANVALTSAQSVLPPGEYSAVSLLGNAPAARVSIGTDGRLGDYVPFATIGPLDSRILALTKTP